MTALLGTRTVQLCHEPYTANGDFLISGANSVLLSHMPWNLLCLDLPQAMWKGDLADSGAPSSPPLLPSLQIALFGPCKCRGWAIGPWHPPGEYIEKEYSPRLYLASWNPLSTGEHH